MVSFCHQTVSSFFFFLCIKKRRIVCVSLWHFHCSVVLCNSVMDQFSSSICIHHFKPFVSVLVTPMHFFFCFIHSVIYSFIHSFICLWKLLHHCPFILEYVPYGKPFIHRLFDSFENFRVSNLLANVKSVL